MAAGKKTAVRESQIRDVVNRAHSIKERLERIGVKRATYQIQDRSRTKVGRAVSDRAIDTHAFHLVPRR